MRLSRSRRVVAMARISVDTSEVRAAIADMSGLDSRLRPDASMVVKKGATNGMDDFEAVIGPNTPGPGAGANIAYFGASRGGGTGEDPEAALDREVGSFEDALGDVAERVVFG